MRLLSIPDCYGTLRAKISSVPPFSHQQRAPLDTTRSCKIYLGREKGTMPSLSLSPLSSPFYTDRNLSRDRADLAHGSRGATSRNYSLFSSPARFAFFFFFFDVHLLTAVYDLRNSLARGLGALSRIRKIEFALPSNLDGRLRQVRALRCKLRNSFLSGYLFCYA